MNQSTPRRVRALDVAAGAMRALPELAGASPNLLRLIGLRPRSRQSIGRVLEYWADKAPDRVALRFEDRQWTYRELNAWANRIAAMLSSRGIRAGDSVGILMENRPEVLACVAGVLKLGAVAGMLNHNQSGEVQAHSIALLKARLIIVGAECRQALESSGCTPAADGERKYLWHGGDEDVAAPEGYLDLARECADQSGENPGSTRQVRAEQACFHIFTSGTTGMPKASVMTHYRWLACMGGFGGATLRLREDDVFYVCLPLYHNNALTVSWASVMASGATLALDRKFSASRFWARIRHYDATAFIYIGELLRYLLNQPASSSDREHRVRMITGNGLRPEIWAEFERRFAIDRIYEFYGASELNIGFINAFGISRTAGFTPMSFAIVEFDGETEQPVRNRRGRLVRVGKGGVGLLISKVTGRRPFDGYTDAAAGEKKLLHDVFRKGDCYFNSGDLVRDQGLRHIQFVDRVGDTFRWKGENVAAGEVEGALAQQPPVEHGVVYGVQVPGFDGRAGMAAITLKPDQAFDGRAMAAALRSALPAYAVPLFIRLRAQQDTTGTFKYRKVELKQQGMDPVQIEEPLYALLDAQTGYEPLTPALHEKICAGQIRL